jgi:hypothetical protein
MFGLNGAFLKFMKVIFTRPVAAFQRDTNLPLTLPVGALVEISPTSSSFFLEVNWNCHCYSVLRDDLLEACTWEDMARIALGEHRSSVWSGS